MLLNQFKAPLVFTVSSSSSPLFTSRASTETTLHTESTEAGTRPAKWTGEAESDKQAFITKSKASLQLVFYKDHAFSIFFFIFND